MIPILKYPRTPHLQGSRLQPGDEDLSQIPFSDIAGKELVVEEKCDGANTGISFDDDGSLLLQSRGHYLVGGAREKHYDLFKEWANIHIDMLFDLLGTRYIMYGEWMYAKHTIFYDALPHYFLEFDIYDREHGFFLDTDSRYAMLKGCPIVSAPLIARRTFTSLEELTSLIGQSRYITANHLTALKRTCEENPKCGPVEARISETDASTNMEGLYMKLEDNGQVVSRLKYVRHAFTQSLLGDSTSHWLARPIVPNLLAYPREMLYAELLPEELRR